MAEQENKKKLIARVKEWYAHVTHKDDPHYISGKEARRIARENFKITRDYEKKKRRRIDEKEYLSEMNRLMISVEAFAIVGYSSASRCRYLNSSFFIVSGILLGVLTARSAFRINGSIFYLL